MASFFSPSLLRRIAFCILAFVSGVAHGYVRKNYRKQESHSSIAALWQNVAFELKGGVVPVIWTDRNSAVCDDCINTSSLAVNSFLQSFKVPWTVGAEMRWSLHESNRVYLDFQYRQAKSKNNYLNVTIFFSPENETLVFNTYRTYSLYVGDDHFFCKDWLCQNVSAFAGIKVGFTHQGPLNLDIFPTNACENKTENCFKERNIFSGGGRFGLEYANLYNCLTVNLTVEILAQTGPRFGAVAIPSSAFSSNATVNAVGTEVLFPVTLGLQYRF